MEWSTHAPTARSDQFAVSLGYSLLTQELVSLIEATGLDPYLGFLHQLDYNRPSLALDLIEPFRYPIVDRLVLRVINRGQVQPSDFQTTEGNGAVHLKPDALKRFLAEYEQALLGRREPYEWRSTMIEEVRHLAKSLREGERFNAFRYEPKHN